MKKALPYLLTASLVVSAGIFSVSAASSNQPATEIITTAALAPNTVEILENSSEFVEDQKESTTLEQTSAVDADADSNKDASSTESFISNEIVPSTDSVVSNEADSFTEAIASDETNPSTEAVASDETNSSTEAIVSDETDSSTEDIVSDETDASTGTIVSNEADSSTESISSVETESPASDTGDATEEITSSGDSTEAITEESTTEAVTEAASTTEAETITEAETTTESVTQETTTVKTPCKKKTTYTITYNANGGSNAPASQTKIKKQALRLTTATPTREGYTFLGWAKKVKTTKVKYTPGSLYTKNSSITLYAVWSQNIIAIKNENDKEQEVDMAAMDTQNQEENQNAADPTDPGDILNDPLGAADTLISEAMNAVDTILNDPVGTVDKVVNDLVTDLGLDNAADDPVGAVDNLLSDPIGILDKAVTNLFKNLGMNSLRNWLPF